MSILNQIETGGIFYFVDKKSLIAKGIDPDQEPFVVTNKYSPVLDYIYAKDRHGIFYLFSGYTSVEKK